MIVRHRTKNSCVLVLDGLYRSRWVIVMVTYSWKCEGNAISRTMRKLVTLNPDSSGWRILVSFIVFLVLYVYFFFRSVYCTAGFEGPSERWWKAPFHPFCLSTLLLSTSLRNLYSVNCSGICTANGDLGVPAAPGLNMPPEGPCST